MFFAVKTPFLNGAQRARDQVWFQLLMTVSLVMYSYIQSRLRDYSTHSN